MKPLNTRWTNIVQLLPFICGSILSITVIATLQMKFALGVDIPLIGYVIPILIGAVIGAALGYTYLQFKQQQAELDRFFNLSIDLLCIINNDGHFLRLNPAFEKILGWPLKTLFDNPLVDFIHPDDLDGTRSEILKLEGKNATTQFENRFRCQDESYKWLSWTARPAPNGRIYAVAHDVTAYKDLESSLRDSGERLHAIVDTAVDGIITIDEKGSIETVNQATEQLFGYKRSEMIGCNVKILMPSPYQEEHDGYLSAYRQTGERKIIGIGREVVGRRKDGTTFPMDLSVAESILDERPMYTGIVRDITERKEAEDSLSQSAARNRALIEAIPDSIMRIHRDGTTLDLEAPTEYASISPLDNMIGRKQQEFLPPLLAAQVMAAVTRAIDEKTLQIFEYEAKLDGKKRIREARIMPISEDEVAVVVRDITEQRETEKARGEAVTAERDRIARDLHDSVTQTLFSTSMIADVLPMMWDINPESARERLDELRELARGALAEMRTLLLELRPAVLFEAELAQLLQQLVDAIVGRARIRGELAIDGEINDLPEDVHVAIYRTVQEALNNVAKHAEASIVTVALKRQEHQLDVTIRDDGRGFDTSTVKGGHFGLTNMQERISAVGGTLSIESEPNHGATITIKLENLP